MINFCNYISVNPSGTQPDTIREIQPNMYLYDLEKDLCAHTIMSNLQQYCRPERMQDPLSSLTHAAYADAKPHTCALCLTMDEMHGRWQGWSDEPRIKKADSAGGMLKASQTIQRKTSHWARSRFSGHVGEDSPLRPPLLDFEQAQGVVMKARQSGELQKHASRSQRRENLAKFPLRNLLSKYRVLDAVSHLKAEVINECLDLIYAEPPSRPLAENLASIYLNPPRPWLAIRGMIRKFHTDVLHGILEVLSDAIVCTDYVLLHSSSHQILTVSEQELASDILFDCIRARRLVLTLLQQKIQSLVLSLVRQYSCVPEPVSLSSQFASPDREQINYYSRKPLPPRPTQTSCYWKGISPADRSNWNRNLKGPSRQTGKITFPAQILTSAISSGIRPGFLTGSRAITDDRRAHLEQASEDTGHRRHSPHQRRIQGCKAKTNTANSNGVQIVKNFDAVILSTSLCIMLMIGLIFGSIIDDAVKKAWCIPDVASLLSFSLVFGGVCAMACIIAVWRPMRKLDISSIYSDGTPLTKMFSGNEREVDTCLFAYIQVIRLAVSNFSRRISITVPQVEAGKVRVKWRCVSLLAHINSRVHDNY